MTTTEHTRVSHPLDAVTAEEISQVRRITVEAGLVSSSTRFVYVGLQEPDKREVFGHISDKLVTRQFRALLLDLESQVSRDVVVDVTAGRVVSEVESDPATSGQLPVLD